MNNPVPPPALTTEQINAGFHLARLEAQGGKVEIEIGPSAAQMLVSALYSTLRIGWNMPPQTRHATRSLIASLVVAFAGSPAQEALEIIDQAESDYLDRVSAARFQTASEKSAESKASQ